MRPSRRTSNPLSEQNQWDAHPIDAFIRARLEREGIAPSPPADRATLLRRVSLDLVGLPPTPDQREAFLASESPLTYTQLIEELLASPHFGERMASAWLDLVRFADTVGFHGDQNQRIYPYRDYVIDAFNQNTPFDAFVREQLAGDLLPNPSDEQLVATGFLRLNMMTREGGAQPGEYLAKYRADRVRALGTAFLGATLGCCECHNHKYDPFTIQDFYSFGAFFDDLRQWGVYSDYGYTPNPDLKGFNNDYPFPPEIRVASASARREIEKLQRSRDQEVFAQRGTDILADPQYRAWRDELTGLLGHAPDGWFPLTLAPLPDENEPSGDVAPNTEALEDGSLLILDTPPNGTYAFQASLPHGGQWCALRIEVLPHERHRGYVGRGADGRFSLKDVSIGQDVDAEGEPQDIPIATAIADRWDPTGFRNGHPLADVSKLWKSGPGRWQLPTDEARRRHTAVFHFTQPLRTTPGQPIRIRFASSDVGCIRLSLTPIGHAIPGWEAAGPLRGSDDAIASGRESEAAFVSAYLRSAFPWAEQAPLLREYRDRIQRLQAGYACSLVAQPLPEDDIPQTRVLPRGNWQDTSGALAPPAFPEFLPQGPTHGNRRRTRLDLANWVTSPENPLTARHFVNRTWKHFFGTGLSAKIDDLGNQGEWPRHPELLDWLARTFMDSGWDVKSLIRLIVTSETYQQSAAMRPELADIDPYNRLLAQQSPRRLEAEIVRDNALAIAGLLVRDYVGGPSVFPYQPAEHYRNLQFPGRKYIANNDWRQYRRGVYMHWQRTFLHPMLVNFDAPSRDECAADRPLSNSPQQALTLLNDPTFSEAAIALALRLAQEAPASTEAQIDRAFQRALARPARPAEMRGLLQLFAEQKVHYAKDPAAAEQFLRGSGLTTHVPSDHRANIAAFAQVCRVVLNLHETITRY